MYRFVIENFGCVPRELKQRITATEWQKIVCIHRKGFIGADRRDVGLAKAAQQICGASGVKVDIEPLLPVKLWDQPEKTADEIASILDSL